MGDGAADDGFPTIAQEMTRPAQTPQTPNLAQESRRVTSLLSMPAELRNQVYEYVFQGWVIAIRPSLLREGILETDIWPDTTNPHHIVGTHGKRGHRRATNVFALLYTCRQIHAETRLLPYNMNTVLCGEKPFPPGLLTNLNVQVARVSSLQLCSDMPANIVLSRTWLKILPRFSNLRTVHIYWTLRVSAWESEEDHLSTATTDEIEMAAKICKATPAACEVKFHRTVIWE